MRQLAEHTFGNGMAAADVSAACRIDEDIGRSVSTAAIVVKGVLTAGRAGSIIAFLLTTTWMSEARASPQQAYAQVGPSPCAPQIARDSGGGAGVGDSEPVRASASSSNALQLAQAVPDDPEALQKSLRQEHDRAALLARELVVHQHLEMLLTLYQARAQVARSKQAPESENKQLPERLQQERLSVTQAAESGAAELCRVLSNGRPEQSQQNAEVGDTTGLRMSLQRERDRANQLEQDLLAAKRDVAAETALVAKATEQAGEAKEQAERDAAGLRDALQQERARTAQFEKDAATAQDSIKTALVSKVNEYASQMKRAERDAVELQRSLQLEQERRTKLEQDLEAARREIQTQTALASKANEDANQAKRAESNVTELGRSLQQEREHAAQLEQDVAAARREVETQSALVSKANLDSARLKQVADQGVAELKQSLQKEHERAEALAKELSTARAGIYAYEAQLRQASEHTTASAQGREDGSATQKSLQQEQQRAARLEQDLASARRDVETQTALAAKAIDDAAQSKRAASANAAEFKGSLQKEHDRAEALARDLSMVHTAIYTYEVQARIASKEMAARAQSAEGSASELRKTLQDEQVRAARLLQDLAAARRNLESQNAVAAEAARMKRSADDSSAEALKSLQQERDKSAQLERQLAVERKKDACAASSLVTTGGTAQDKTSAVNAIRPVAMNQATTTGASGVKPTPVNAVEVERLVARASTLLRQGDIGSARIVLQRAADTGSPQASFALAETFDPFVLRRWGAYGTLGDPGKARDLYAKAQAGGVREAKERLDALR
ncbi:MAG: hypothetical protein JOZ58_06290 [Acetobacteraceae bacterium]|nr:hypothetical protein [Acetobacteraceae bacterium]